MLLSAVPVIQNSTGSELVFPVNGVVRCTPDFGVSAAEAAEVGSDSRGGGQGGGEEGGRTAFWTKRRRWNLYFLEIEEKNIQKC